jgi:hypothetical protein
LRLCGGYGSLARPPSRCEVAIDVKDQIRIAGAEDLESAAVASGSNRSVRTDAAIRCIQGRDQRLSLTGRPQAFDSFESAATALILFRQEVDRNALIGPGSNSTNAAMMKNFAIPAREGMYVQFRAEAFSLFNTPIFSKPGNTLGSSLGKITSASGDRQIQFALKLVF